MNSLYRPGLVAQTSTRNGLGLNIEAGIFTTVFIFKNPILIIRPVHWIRIPVPVFSEAFLWLSEAPYRKLKNRTTRIYEHHDIRVEANKS